MTTKKVRLFVYGLLKPQYDQPKSATDIRHDSVRGNLYDLGSDAALVDVGDPKAHWCRGYTMLVDEKEAKTIDHFEHPQYRRVPVETWSGVTAHVYEYVGRIPPKAERLENWHPSPKNRHRKAAAGRIK